MVLALLQMFFFAFLVVAPLISVVFFVLFFKFFSVSLLFPCFATFCVIYLDIMVFLLFFKICSFGAKVHDKTHYVYLVGEL